MTPGLSNGPQLAFTGLAIWMGWAIVSGSFLRAYASLLYTACSLAVPPDHPVTTETLRMVCVLCVVDVWTSQSRLG